MADPKIRLKRSSVENKIPTPDQVPLGEIALNTYDGYLYASKNVGVGTTVIAINPFRVGTGTNTYNAYFTAGNVGIGSEIPTTKLDVDGTVTATSFAGSGANLTGLTGASAATYGSTGLTPVITVDANGRITGITTVTTSGSGGGIAQISDDTTPQLGGDLDINGNNIDFGDSTSTTDDRLSFGADDDFQIYHNGTNTKLADRGTGNLQLITNSNIVFLHQDNEIDPNPETLAKFISDGANELYYDGSKKFETTNDGIVITGIATATSFVKSGGTSSQFLKADGSVDSSTYLTSYTETDPVVAAINGIVKSDGTTISAATAGTDYLTDVSQDTTPQLGGNLDLNSKDITGTGNIDITGNLDITGVSTFSSSVGIGTRIDIIPYDTQNDGTLSFEGSAGQLFSITNQLSSGSIFSVNDISGIPSIDVDADGTIQLAPIGAGEKVGIGTTLPTVKLDVVGDAKISGVVTATSFVGNLTGISTGTTRVYVDESADDNASHNLVFINAVSPSSPDTQGDAYLELEIDSNGISFNPSTNTLNVNNVAGIATGATRILVDESEDDDNDYNIIFTDVTPGSGNQYYTLQVDDNGLKFNPGTNTFSVSGIQATSYVRSKKYHNHDDITTLIDFSDGGDILLQTGNTTRVAIGTDGYTTINNGINVTGVATFSGNVTIGGTLTYEDVTNIDSVGLITARSGINVSAGGINVTGITTSTSFVKSSNSGGFLKADGTEDTNTYLTSYTETQTLDDVLGLGNTSTTGLSVGVVTTTALKGFEYLQAPHGTSVNIDVKVITKTAAHRYNGTGSSSGYTLNGVESPFLTLTPGRTYNFKQDDSSNLGHPFRFYLEADKTTQYTEGVTSVGTPGNANSMTAIEVTDETPVVLHYQCSAHGYMGNAVQVNSNKVNTPYQIDGLNGANITGVVTATSFSGSSATIASGHIILNNNGASIIGPTTATSFVKSSNSGGFLKADGTEDTNTYLTSYTETDPVVAAINGIVKSNGTTISAATAGTDYLTPSGDGSGLTGLTGASAATYGSAGATPVIVVDSDGRITGISTVATSGAGGGGGISNVVEDTTPQLGGDLDLNSKNITGTGNANITGVITATTFGGSGSNLTGLTGASAATYGSATTVPQIVVDSNGRITGITNVTITGGGGGGGGISNVLEDTTPQLGGNLDLNSKNITGTGNVNISGTVTATSFVGNGSALTGVVTSFASKNVNTYTATAGQTTFAGTYTVGYVDVYLNGSKLSEDQYTASNGTSIVLDEGASLGDIVEVVGVKSAAPPLATRNTETLTIGSIASGVTTTGTITLPKTGVMISIHPVGDASGWLRLYTRSDLATADASRARTQDPNAGSGVILETITSGISTVYLSPQTIFASAEDTPINTFNYRFTKDGTAGITTFTFKYLSLEP